MLLGKVMCRGLLLVHAQLVVGLHSGPSSGAAPIIVEHNATNDHPAGVLPTSDVQKVADLETSHSASEAGEEEATVPRKRITREKSSHVEAQISAAGQVVGAAADQSDDGDSYIIEAPSVEAQEASPPMADKQGIQHALSVVSAWMREGRMPELVQTVLLKPASTEKIVVTSVVAALFFLVVVAFGVCLHNFTVRSARAEMAKQNEALIEAMTEEMQRREQAASASLQEERRGGGVSAASPT
mmetsp:Transcript_12706/g.30399  ORF Transcript_12706/g.30399 Transcript_12706/m.30399 type:complete len:242 (+) Transcript_12706:122-847(+)